MPHLLLITGIFTGTIGRGKRRKELILLSCINEEPTENPRVGADSGPVRYRPWEPFFMFLPVLV